MPFPYTSEVIALSPSFKLPSQWKAFLGARYRLWGWNIQGDLIATQANDELTYYDAKAQISLDWAPESPEQVDVRIRDFVAQYLNVPKDEAFKIQKDYYRRYGTTMRGIGPAYEDKAGRRSIRVMAACRFWRLRHTSGTAPRT